MKRGQGATKDKKVDANIYTHRPTKKPSSLPLSSHV